MTGKLTLISHHLCPYVQRAAIALAEKGVPFERIDIDLADKPDWFLALSPLGKVPVLKVGDRVIFESAVILEFLEETQPNPLHPADPAVRAEHRSWIEFGSAVLADVWVFETTADPEAFADRAAALADKFGGLEARLGDGPWFDGARFSLVDAVFAPVFRAFDVFEAAGALVVLEGRPKLAAWRRALAARPSVRAAVAADYPARLRRFLAVRESHLARLLDGVADAARRVAA